MNIPLWIFILTCLCASVYSAVVRFRCPGLTETQLFLQTFHIKDFGCRQ